MPAGKWSFTISRACPWTVLVLEHWFFLCSFKQLSLELFLQGPVRGVSPLKSSGEIEECDQKLRGWGLQWMAPSSVWKAGKALQEVPATAR
jgi:hypothetical protein